MYQNYIKIVSLFNILSQVIFLERRNEILIYVKNGEVKINKGKSIISIEKRKSLGKLIMKIRKEKSLPYQNYLI